MALADFLALGNSAKGAYDAQMQAIVNAQNQQRINDMLANDALKRHLMQQRVTGGGMGLMALGATPTAQPPAPVASPVAPAPAPGQNSAQQPAPQQVPMPGAGHVAQFTPQGGFSNVTTPQQVQRGMALGTIPWQQGASIIKDMQARGVVGQQFAQGQQPGGAGMAPAPAAVPAQAPQGIPSDTQGIVGKSLALAQNNLPVSLVAKFVQNFKRMYPNATPEQAYFAMQQASPVLTAQATDASRLAGMGIDSLFKGLTSWAQITNAQTRQQELPSMIRRNNAMAKFYELGTGQSAVGTQGGPQGPAVGTQTYIETGVAPPMGRNQRYGFQAQVDQQLQQLGVPSGALPSVWDTYKSSQGAQNNLQKNYSQFQTSASTLHATYQRAAQLAKQLELDGVAKVNQGRLFIDRSLAPTGSPQAQLVAQYDALLNEMKRDYGVVSAFGKMTGYGFKSASDVFDPNRGVALDGVNAAIQFGTTQGENAFQTTLSNLQNAAQIKLIDLSKNKEAAANAVGFQLGAPDLVQQYAKKYNMTPQEARSQLLAQRIYVGN